MHPNSSYEQLFEELQRRKVYRVAAAYINCGGIHHSDRIGSFPGMGITKLDPAPGRRALAHWLSDRTDSLLGLRRHSSGDSGNSNRISSRNASSPLI